MDTGPTEANTLPTTHGNFVFARNIFPSVLTILGLATVGWCGHTTHWTFQWHSADQTGTNDHVSVAANNLPEHSGPPISKPVDEKHYQIDFRSPETVARTGIQVAPVSERPLTQEVTGTGAITYDERIVAQLAPRVSGTVWRVDKRLGDLSQKGEVLAIIESESVGKLKAEFLNALVALDSLEEVYRRLISVKNSIPESQLREANAELREARIRLLNAEQSIVNLGLPLDKVDYVGLSDEERSTKIRVLGLPDSIITSLDSTRLSSNLLPLVAPFHGVIISREAVIGEVVDPSHHVFEIADTSRMWITLDINKEDITLVSPGQMIFFRPDGLDYDLSSHVEWISTELNQETRTLQVRAPVENPLLEANNRLLRAHTYGTGRIIVRENYSARVVPRESVQWDGREYVLFVQDSPTCFTGQAVKIGLRDREFVEILDPLDVGTHVAVAGSHMMKAQWQLYRLETATR